MRYKSDMTTTTYRIRVTGTASQTLGHEAFVCDRDATGFGDWYTHMPGRAKSWKTLRGAQRWLAERPGVQGAVEEVAS